MCIPQGFEEYEESMAVSDRYLKARSAPRRATVEAESQPKCADQWNQGMIRGAEYA